MRSGAQGLGLALALARAWEAWEAQQATPGSAVKTGFKASSRQAWSLLAVNLGPGLTSWRMF